MPFDAVSLGLALGAIWLAVLAAVALLFVRTWWRERRGRWAAIPDQPRIVEPGESTLLP